MKFGQLVEQNMNHEYFSRKYIHKMQWGNYFQALFYKIKIEHISGSIV